MMVNGMNGGGHATLAEWELSFVDISKNDSVLDCGCGGGALSIAVAKKNPKAAIIGCDLWGKEYEFSKLLVEKK